MKLQTTRLFLTLCLLSSLPVFSQNTFLNNLKSAAGFGVLSGHDIILDTVNNIEGWIGAANQLIIHPDSSNPSFQIANSNQVNQALQSFNQVFIELQTQQGVILTNSNLSGLTLNPGTYRIPGGLLLPTGDSLTLFGNPNDVFIFDVTGDITIANNSTINIQGVSPSNIFWVTSNNASVGAHSTFLGNIMAIGNISISTQVAGTYAAFANGNVKITRSDGINAPGFYSGGGGGVIGITGKWDLLGNTGTNVGNFLGTTDAQGLTIKTNNVPRMIFGNEYGIYSNEFIGIQKLPTERLDVNGAIKIGSDVNNYVNPQGGTIKFENNNFLGYRNGDNVSYPGAWYPLGSHWTESANALYYYTKPVQIGNPFVDLETTYAPSLKVAGKAFIGSTNNNITIGTGGDYAENTMIESNGGNSLLINYYSGNGLFVGGTLNVGKTYGGTGTGDLYVAGKVGIGTKTPDKELTVKGGIHSMSVTVDLNFPFPDYVFDKDYKLMSLSELRLFIEQHKHLPNIPSKAEVEKSNSIDLGVMNTKLLEKVEELTLYILEQQKELNEIKKHLEKNNK